MKQTFFVENRCFVKKNVAFGVYYGYIDIAFQVLNCSFIV